MIRVALSDLDDTLIPFGAARASQRAIEAIHRMQDVGLRFGPVTGRTPAAMTWMFDGDERCYATGAFANGQIVRIDGTTVKTVCLPSDALRHVQRLLDEWDLGVWLCRYGLSNPRDVALVTTHPERVLENPPRTWQKSVFSIERTVDDSPHVKCNLQCSCPRPAMLEARDLLRAEVPELDFVLPSQTAAVIDINAAWWGKGHAVRLMAHELGVGLDEVAVFGDSENDLSLMGAVPHSVAVANAAPEVARTARWHIGPADQDSVADALCEICRAAQTGTRPSFMAKAFNRSESL